MDSCNLFLFCVCTRDARLNISRSSLPLKEKKNKNKKSRLLLIDSCIVRTQGFKFYQNWPNSPLKVDLFELRTICWNLWFTRRLKGLCDGDLYPSHYMNIALRHYVKIGSLLMTHEFDICLNLRLWTLQIIYRHFIFIGYILTLLFSYARWSAKQRIACIKECNRRTLYVWLCKKETCKQIWIEEFNV